MSGVKDTGLCGNYWNVSEGGRRRSKPPETLQMGKSERRGSVGSVGSEKSVKDSPAAGIKKSASVATPKSSKKQVSHILDSETLHFLPNLFEYIRIFEYFQVFE